MNPPRIPAGTSSLLPQPYMMRDFSDDIFRTTAQCSVCTKFVTFLRGTLMAQCPNCSSILNLGFSASAPQGQCACLACSQLILFPLGAERCRCFNCGSIQMPPPTRYLTCKSCMVYLAYAPTNVNAIVCSVCGSLQQD